MPLSGKVYRVGRVKGIRRVILRATRYHVYYCADRDTVTVLAVWSAVRGRGPSMLDLIQRKRRTRKPR